MRYGPLIFLAAFLALASSWLGFVLTPQLQLGYLQQTNTVPSGATYPLARQGLAQEGLQVYRANGCAYCHTQQIEQRGTVCDLVLLQPGTNQPALMEALAKVVPGMPPDKLERLTQDLPQPILRGLTKDRADALAKEVSAGGAKVEVWIVPTGSDIARGWGRRRTVAEDFLFDSPALPGMQRIGPDLANVAARQPDPAWHLRHLYAPAVMVKGSMMPPYRYLFKTQKVGRQPAPDALFLPAEVGVEPGFEVVPTRDARALAAYLVSLRADAPLFSTPMTVPSAAPPAGGGTNAAPDSSSMTNASPEATAGTANPTNSAAASPTQAAGQTNAPAK